MLKLKLQHLSQLIQRTDSLEKTRCWEGLRAGGEGDDRGWDGWMESLTQWTWVWVGSRSWWWTGRPGILQSMGLQRVGHDWVTELNWTELGWLWGCFQKRLALESVDWVKQMAPPTWLGFIQPIEDLHKQIVRRENSLVLPSCLSWDISLLPRDWDLYHQQPPPNQFSRLWTWSRAHTLNSSSSQAFGLELN